MQWDIISAAAAKGIEQDHLFLNCSCCVPSPLVTQLYLFSYFSFPPIKYFIIGSLCFPILYILKHSLSSPPLHLLITQSISVSRQVAPNSAVAEPLFLNHALLLDACHPAPPQKKEPFERRGEVCFPLAVGFSLPRMPRPSASPLPCNRASGTAADWQRVSGHLISLHIITQAQREWCRK